MASAGPGLGSKCCTARRPCVMVHAVQSQPKPKGGPKPGPMNTSQSRLGLLRAAQLTAKERATLVSGLSGTLPREGLPGSNPGESPATQTSPSQAQAEMVWIFSYGGNMHCESLTSKDVKIGSRDPAFVVDPSIRMVFKHRGGQATLESLQAGSQQQPRFKPHLSTAGDGCVHGVLYRVPKQAVRQFQSHDQGYVMTEMEVETYDGKRVSALVFVSGPLSKLPQEVVPPEMYMRKLREGAAFNFLDPVYQGWLSSIETVTSAGLGSEYYSTPGRYISYSFLLISLTIIGGYLAQHL